MGKYGIPIISAVVHYRIAHILRGFPEVRRVVDIGGTGRLKLFGNWEVTDANRRVNGCDLPYSDDFFDAAISNATLEHVKDQAVFVKEAQRVSRIVAIHWHPAGEPARRTEVPQKNNKTQLIPCHTVGEHLLTLATLYPKLNTPELHEHIRQDGHLSYGYLVIYNCAP